jgi:aspartyl aminopeptidase
MVCMTSLRTAANAEGLCRFIDASPSPFHACATAAKLLAQRGFTELDERAQWPAQPGRHFAQRGGSLIAWSTEKFDVKSGFRIVGAHTDSPNLRVKQHPDLRHGEWRVVALEPYGGAWLNTWLDRDLGVSGRLSVRTPDGIREALVHLDEPILRVPNLAIHLSEDRAIPTINPQRHLNGVWALGDAAPGFVDYVAGRVNVAPRDVLAFDLMTHDIALSTLAGAHREFVSAPRLDNQVTCYTGIHALLAAAEKDAEPVPVLALFDHEEVGSTSDRGAASDFLNVILERIVLAGGGNREAFLRAKAASVLASGDMAHATHPNHPERHEPSHQIAIGGGPVLKVHQNLRYASDAASSAVFALACAEAGVPLQRYTHRADLPAGSTIGPMAAARTGISTVDVGAPMLAMHSARELMGAADVGMYADSLAAFLSPGREAPSGR